jgi:8-oxo-dGTP pyrophosphatase MutT (NUDIX family)
MESYAYTLVKNMNKSPVIGCAAVAIIMNKCNEILLVHRGDNDTWGLPGGWLELGETVEEAARREIFEETGLTLGVVEFLGVYSGKELYHIYPNGQEVYFVTSAFVSADYKGNAIEDGIETKEVSFFSMDNLPALINPSCKPIINDFIEKYNNGMICYL